MPSTWPGWPGLTPSCSPPSTTAALRPRLTWRSSAPVTAWFGPVTSLAYILTLEDPHRFRKSRELGACLGLVPRTDQSGAQDPQLHITKTGDSYLRRVLGNPRVV